MTLFSKKKQQIFVEAIGELIKQVDECILELLVAAVLWNELYEKNYRDCIEYFGG